MDAFNWTCAYCGQATTITDPNYSEQNVHISSSRSKFGDIGLKYIAIACPNADCRELTLGISLKHAEDKGTYWRYKDNSIETFRLMPKSKAKPQPEYIPVEIRKNYEEACLILNDSPKASAAMARRCLQGIVRDFWNIPEGKRGNLGAEINFIKEQVTEDTWDAIHAVRSVGDIGAHMAKDVNFIVEIEPDEADLLVQLIETLFEDWYVAREKRQVRNKNLKDLADRKLQQNREAKQAAKANKVEAEKGVEVEEDE